MMDDCGSITMRYIQKLSLFSHYLSGGNDGKTTKCQSKRRMSQRDLECSQSEGSGHIFKNSTFFSINFGIELIVELKASCELGSARLSRHM